MTMVTERDQAIVQELREERRLLVALLERLTQEFDAPGGVGNPRFLAAINDARTEIRHHKAKYGREAC